MFSHILVPTDFTDKSLKALDIAKKLAENEGTKITLLHVIETLDDAAFEEFEDFYEKIERRAHREMDAVLRDHGTPETRIEKELVYGKRAEEIVRYSDQNSVDLIVLASHKIDPDNPAKGWSTISYKVGVLSGCPVMMVK